MTNRLRSLTRTTLMPLKDEAGIAAVTVLLVIAVLGSLGALVLVAAQEDLRFGVLDTAAEQALNKAEAGLDAAAEYLFLHTVLPSETCSVSPASGTCLRLINPTTGQGDIQVAFLEAHSDGEWVDFQVTSSAVVRGTRRTLQQEMRASLLGLPYGMFIRGNLDFGGTPKLFNESVLVEGNITSRDKVDFDLNGNNLSDDPDMGWIFHKPYIKARGGPPVPGCTVDEPACTVPAIKKCGTILYPHLGPPAREVACAGAFAAGQISITAASQEEHTSADIAGWKNPNSADCGGSRDCKADRDSHQRINATTPVVDVPDNLAIIKHLDELRRTAEDQGLYFKISGNGNDNIVYNPCDFKATTCNSINPHKHHPKDLVFFWDTDSGDTIRLAANLKPADMDASCTTDFNQPHNAGDPEVSSRSGLIIIRGGASLEMASGMCWSGAVFNPDGNLKLAGGIVFVGTVTVKNFSSQGSNSIKLESNWFGRMPAGFREIQRSAWVECQEFATC